MSSVVGQVKVKLVFAFVVLVAMAGSFVCGTEMHVGRHFFQFWFYFFHSFLLNEPRLGKDFLEPLALLFY